MALIGIDAFQFEPDATFSGDTCELRLWYSESFIDSSGTPISRGTATTGFRINVPCTIVSGEVHVPSFNVWSTLDAQSPAPQSIQINSALYTSGGAATGICPFSQSGAPSQWMVPNPTPATTMTFVQWTIFNQSIVLANPPFATWTSLQIQQYFNTLNPAPNASDITKGITKLSVAPASATNPIAVGSNDYATTSNPGIGKSSVTRSPTSEATFVETTDPRVNPNQPLLITGTGSGISVGNILSKSASASNPNLRITPAGATSGVIGIATEVDGTAITFAQGGKVTALFDSPFASNLFTNEYVQISSSVAGTCTKAGDTFPTDGQVIGRILSYTVGQSEAVIELFAAEVQASRSPVGAAGGDLALTYPNPRLAINVKAYGAKGDVVDNATGVGGTASVNNTSTTINDSAGSLTNADIGKTFVLQGAGASGAAKWGPIGYGISSGTIPSPSNSTRFPLIGTIVSINSPTSFESSVPAQATVSNMQMYYGTDDTAAFAAAYAATPSGGVLLVPQSGHGYIANLTITKPIFLRGDGAVQPCVFTVSSTLETIQVDNIKGVVIRTATNADVLTIQNASGVSVENIAFDGARISPYAIKVDRGRYLRMVHLAGTRAATAGMIIGNSQFAGGTYGVDDGSFFDVFDNIFLYGPSGLILSKFGAASKGFANLSDVANIHIEYYGQGTNDHGLYLVDTGNAWFRNIYAFDHFNTSNNPWAPAGPPTPKVGIYFAGPYVDGYSCWNNTLYNVTTTSLEVAAGNPYAGTIFNYQITESTDQIPVIGAGSGLTWSSEGRGVDTGTPASSSGWHVCGPDRFFSVSTGDNAKYTGFSIGRATEGEASFGITALIDQFFVGAAAGEGNVKVLDGTKRLNLGVGSGVAQVRILPTSIVLSNGTDNFLGLGSFGGKGIVTTTASNTDLAGVLTLSGGGTATYNFVGTYSTAPIVIVTQVGGAATIVPRVSASSTSAFTVTGDAGATVNYIVIGRT